MSTKKITHRFDIMTYVMLERYAKEKGVSIEECAIFFIDNKVGHTRIVSKVSS